jgi:DNA-binding MarR family transcriptional regulator
LALAETASEQPNLGVLLFIPYRAMEDRVFTALREAGFGDLTTAQARVFQRIAPRGSRITDLARQAQVTKQTAGFLVDQLERVGYVERVPDPSDARAKLVRVASRGEQAVAASAKVVAEVEAEWTAHLGQRRAAELRRSLTRLREITDPFGEP